jgi:hypothetical protein
LDHLNFAKWNTHFCKDVRTVHKVLASQRRNKGFSSS